MDESKSLNHTKWECKYLEAPASALLIPGFHEGRSTITGALLPNLERSRGRPGVKVPLDLLLLPSC